MKTREEEIEKAAKELCPVYGADVAAIERRCGFMDGAQWADSHPKNPWRDARKELPKLMDKEYGESELVFICFSDGRLGKAWYSYTYKMWEYKEARIPEPAYWMYIPSLPKGGER